MTNNDRVEWVLSAEKIIEAADDARNEEQESVLMTADRFYEEWNQANEWQPDDHQIREALTHLELEGLEWIDVA